MSFQRVAVLSIGEMGYHWSRFLAGRGIDVWTCLRGRSERTRRRAESAGAKPVSLRQIAAEADLIVSVVVPSAAKRVAARVAALLSRSGRRGLVYLDANAVSPMAALEMSGRLSQAGAAFVDGSIIGSAAMIGEGTITYLSGPHAARLGPLESLGLSLKILGPQVGQASAFKMLYAGLTKGLQGLFTELLVGAQKLQMLEAILERYEESYPGLTAKAGGGIAALAVHAGRRAEEMAELSRTFRHYGLRAVMAPATRRLLTEISRLGSGSPTETGEREKNWLKTLEYFAQQGLLETRPASEAVRR